MCRGAVSAEHTAAAEKPAVRSRSRSGRRGSGPEARLADVAGCGRRSGFTHLHGFLGPRSYCLLGTVAPELSSQRVHRAPFAATALYERRTGPMRRLLSAAMRNDREEAWVHLVDRARAPAQAEKDAALAWTLKYPARRSMAMLLRRHGARSNHELEAESGHVDMVFEMEHSQSARHALSSRDIAVAMAPRCRAEVISWLTRACDAARLEDPLLAGAVLTLDRYYAARRTAVEDGALHRLTLAALCTEMKLAGAEAGPAAQPAQRAQILVHLAQGRETMKSILETEAALLSTLGFRAGVVTPTSLLRSLAYQFLGGVRALAVENCPTSSCSHVKRVEEGVAAWGDLASFLVELAMYDAELEYRYAPAVLATAALGAALLCLGSSQLFAPQVCAACPLPEFNRECTEGLHGMLLAELDGGGLEQPEAAGELLKRCEGDLLDVWAECSAGSSPWTECYARLCGKYARLTQVADGQGGAAAALDGLARFGDLYGHPAGSRGI